MTAGFVQTGFEPVAAIELDAEAAATYAANFGEEHIRCGDIAEWREGIPEVDVVIGGPPCQGFSNLGSREPGDPRNSLSQEYLRVVGAASPRVFVIENVDRFLSSREFRVLAEQTLSGGALEDYHLEAAILNAADYGVPQRRRRTIVIGSRIGTPRMPPPTHAEEPTGSLSRWETVAEHLGDLPWDTTTNQLPNATTPIFDMEMPGTFKGLDLHVGRNPTELSKRRYQHIPPGGGRFDLPDELLPPCWRNKPNGTTDVMGRMRWDRPSLTIRTEFFKPEKGQYLHPQWEEGNLKLQVNRAITHLEAARLQTLPEDFLWCGTKNSIAKQIGNAVPSRLAAAIASFLQSDLLI